MMNKKNSGGLASNHRNTGLRTTSY